MNIKTITLTALCSILICAAGARAAEVKIDQTVVSGGGYIESTMQTSSSMFDGTMLWTAEYSSYNHPQYPQLYHMEYLVDDTLEGGMTYYWLPEYQGYLRIDLPEPIYITKIRTYNVASTGSYSFLRWSEATLKTSTDGINFTQAGEIDLDADPHQLDYVDIVINAYITSILFDDKIVYPSPTYYAMNEIEFYTDNTIATTLGGVPTNSIPEPASIMLLLAGCAGLLKRLKK